MKLKVQIVIMSHLSDVQDCLHVTSNTYVVNNKKRINFAKYLLLKYPNTDVEVDIEKEAEEFELQQKMKIECVCEHCGAKKKTETGLCDVCYKFPAIRSKKV